MGSLPPELSLDQPPSFVNRAILNLARDAVSSSDAAVRSSKINDLLCLLEDEMRKIDGFKRELPLCMVLLRDAIAMLKLETVQCPATPPLAAPPVMAMFMPLTKDSDDSRAEIESLKEKEEESKDKNLDLQLGTNLSPDSAPNVSRDVKVETKKCDLLSTQSAAEDVLKPIKSRNGGRGFIQPRPLSPPPATVFPRKEDKVDLPVHNLSFLTPDVKSSREKLTPVDARPNFGRSLAQSGQSSLRSAASQLNSRKQRRCWSQELHQRFVNALQQLGGSQAATPKQIRELMQVDGLTNDEVKSHLQKYRLHTRRFPTASGSNANQQVSVLGGLWQTREQSDDPAALKGSTSQSGSPQGPLHLCGSAGAASTTGGDSMEDDSDSKSESFGWKSQINGTGKVNV